MSEILIFTDLTAMQLFMCMAVAFIAGAVRGFSGFALSALVMASLALTLSPLELLPICWMLEFAAGLLMVRGGIRDANMRVAFGLVIGGAIGVPIALYLNHIVSADTSRLIAFAIIIVLALLQLARVKAAFLATESGLYGSGFLSGMATGFAGVGGMVVALYVLAREAPAKMMRGSLVMYLFMSNILALGYYIAYGMMTEVSVSRGLLLVVPCLLGVLIGQMLFRPSMEKYYKPFCLLLLVGLASVGLVRLGLN